MADQLPTFRFHPDPLGTGSIQPAEVECVCCGETRGYVYVGPVYAEDEYEECICPWCIASGRAHDELDAEFTDYDGVGGYGADVPDASRDEVAFRTPGFAGWQQERWWVHCGEAAAFIGRAGAQEVLGHGNTTVEHLRRDLGWEPGERFDRYVRALDANGQPTAYLFRCLRCAEVGGYSDFT